MNEDKKNKKKKKKIRAGKKESAQSEKFNFDNEIAIEALESGALASGLSGSGSSTVAIVDDENLDEVKDAWINYSDAEIIVTKTNNKGTFTL